MAVNQIAWSLTTATFLIVALVLFLSGYNGYGGVFVAVALSAAINLVPIKRGPRQREAVTGPASAQDPAPHGHGD